MELRSCFDLNRRKLGPARIRSNEKAINHKSMLMGANRAHPSVHAVSLFIVQGQRIVGPLTAHFTRRPETVILLLLFALQGSVAAKL